MDDFQGRLTESLQFKLSAWLLLVILGVALVAGVFSYWATFQDANELQDDQLKQVAALIDRNHLPVLQAQPQETAPDTNPGSRVIVQALASGGVQAPRANDYALALPANLPDGIQTVMVSDVGWRLFVRTLNSGGRVVVGQQTAVRDEIARDSAFNTLMPFGVLIPTLLLLVGYLIRRMFKPVRQLASELDHRSEQDLHEVSEARLPSEIRPFVMAINRLLGRVTRSMALQRRFVADAAHELRSPLTALSLQAERLEAADMSVDARERLGTLQQGLRRARDLVAQLLTLARVQEPVTGKTTQVPLQPVLREVLEDLMPLAQAKQIDLGVVGQGRAVVFVQRDDLKTLLRNLVENAVRYTPRGGRVDVSVHVFPGQVVLQVDDTGPGIPEDERERVFDPFYRILGNDEVGSGLGLSIVRTIAGDLARKSALKTSQRRGTPPACA